MKLDKSVLLAFGLLIVIGSVFRVAGFAPQIAMAVFGAAVIRDKRLAFVLPLVSMLLSDVLYEVLFYYGYTPYGGIYEGQITNYLILMVTVLAGFMARNLNPARIAAVSVAAPILYFLLSNFMVWLGGGGFHRPISFSGLMLCYEDALPFLRSSLESTLVFSVVLFGGYFLLNRYVLNKKQLA